jgi:hypothetical protein
MNIVKNVKKIKDFVHIKKEHKMLQLKINFNSLLLGKRNLKF